MGIGEQLFGSKWFMSQVEKEAAKDKVPPSEMVGQVFSVVAGVIFIAFFAIHQTRPTGFFTEDFTSIDSVLLYFLLVIGMFSPIVRFIFGRKNIARPFDAFGMVVVFVLGLYFLIKFPFDFTHFEDPLPRFLEPVLAWVTADIAKILLGIGVVASPFFSAYTFALYFAVKKRIPGLCTEPKP